MQSDFLQEAQLKHMASMGNFIRMQKEGIHLWTKSLYLAAKCFCMLSSYFAIFDRENASNRFKTHEVVVLAPCV